LDQMGFILDPAFENSSVAVGRLGLCEVRLQADARWPWLVLIPARPGLREIEDLDADLRAMMLEEAILAGRAVHAIGEAAGFKVQKLNLGALGNITPQLHLHVVGRRAGDPAWPGPVWGAGDALPYSPEFTVATLAAARRVLDIPASELGV